jgi:hypothetical protein
MDRLACLAVFIAAYFYGGFSLLAQGQEDSMIRELVRKANAREQESGFCARTGWPSGESRDGFTEFLRGAALNSWKVNTFRNKTVCNLDRVTKVHQENGGKCVTYDGWVCDKDKGCSVYKTVDCLDRNGKFVTRRNAN